MKEHLKSFFAAYFFIPVIFYLIDMACQSTFVTGNVPTIIILNIVLTVCSLVAFQFLLQQRTIRILSPMAASIGGIVGLLHAFQYYMIIGTFWVWHNAKFVGFTAEEMKLIWVNFYNPFFNFEDMMCDGAGPAIVLVSALFVFYTTRRIRPGSSSDA